MPNDKISSVTTYGGDSKAGPFGDVDESASLQQIPGVYTPPMPPTTKVTSLDTGNYGGINSIASIPPNTDDVTFHQSVGEQEECAGSLTRPPKEYSHE